MVAGSKAGLGSRGGERVIEPPRARHQSDERVLGQVVAAATAGTVPQRRLPHCSGPQEMLPRVAQVLRHPHPSTSSFSAEAGFFMKKEPIVF